MILIQRLKNNLFFFFQEYLFISKKKKLMILNFIFTLSLSHSEQVKSQSWQFKEIKSSYYFNGHSQLTPF
jgi:hypothetical protein